MQNVSMLLVFSYILKVCNLCQKEKAWQNQPVLGKLPLLNLMLSAAILLSGCGIAKTFRMFSYMQVNVTLDFFMIKTLYYQKIKGQTVSVFTFKSLENV